MSAIAGEKRFFNLIRLKALNINNNLKQMIICLLECNCKLIRLKCSIITVT